MLRLVRDETPDRQDLASRRESKFVIDDMDVDVVRKRLTENIKKVAHNGSVSTVRSIYFDDPQLSACHANLDGLSKRSKLRLRWYDTLLPGRNCYLEIKWRENRVTGKHRMLLELNRPLSDLSYQTLLQQLEKIVPPRFAKNVICNSEPVVIVEYRREHFVSNDQRLRLTLDYDLRFYNQYGKSHASLSFPVSKERFAVIEGKTVVGEEKLLRATLHPMKFRAARCSKYVHGCRAIGLIQERVS